MVMEYSIIKQYSIVIYLKLVICQIIVCLWCIFLGNGDVFLDQFTIDGMIYFFFPMLARPFRRIFQPDDTIHSL